MSKLHYEAVNKDINQAQTDAWGWKVNVAPVNIILIIISHEPCHSHCGNEENQQSTAHQAEQYGRISL